jgi:hypothetical protein
MLSGRFAQGPKDNLPSVAPQFTESQLSAGSGLQEAQPLHRGRDYLHQRGLPKRGHSEGLLFGAGSTSMAGLDRCPAPTVLQPPWLSARWPRQGSRMRAEAFLGLSATMGGHGHHLRLRGLGSRARNRAVCRRSAARSLPTGLRWAMGRFPSPETRKAPPAGEGRERFVSEEPDVSRYGGRWLRGCEQLN